MDWMASHARPLVDSIVYSIVGTVVLGLSFYVIEKLLPFSMRKEIAEDQNVSLGIILGAFVIDRPGNVQIKLNAPVSNSWIYVDGALINEETGAVDEFDVEVSYYSGVDSDGSWSEGGRTASRYIPAVAPGRYTLRLEPQWGDARTPPSGYDVTVYNRVPRFSHLFLVVVALLAWPLLRLWRYLRFETARWSESDHPWVESGDSGDDDE